MHIHPEVHRFLSREDKEKLLGQRGIPHEVLNAKQHTREAEIVTQAGRLGAVTVATNMAGRGVDILLGGNPEGLARHDVLKEGYAASAPDLSSLVIKLRRARPDVILHTGYNPDITLFLRQAK